MSYINFNIKLIFITIFFYVIFLLIAFFLIRGVKKNNKLKYKKLLYSIISVTTSAIIILISVVHFSSLAKASDIYKEVEIIDIVESNGSKIGYKFDTFTIYYKDGDKESSGHVYMFSPKDLINKASKIKIGDIIKIKITGGFNIIYDIETEYE